MADNDSTLFHRESVSILRIRVSVIGPEIRDRVRIVNGAAQRVGAYRLFLAAEIDGNARVERDKLAAIQSGLSLAAFVVSVILISADSFRR